MNQATCRSTCREFSFLQFSYSRFALILNLFFLNLFGQSNGRAQGIPEPDYVMYGVVQNATSNASLPVVYGTLTWIFQPNSGAPITNTLTLTNINKQFSYALTLRCESEVAGFPTSSNALKLAATPTTYNRSSVLWNGVPVAFVQPSLTNLTLAPSGRGIVERVDLRVAVPVGDSDQNGFIDEWERFYFGHLGVDPDGDDDRDGMTNVAEYVAGTDPSDADSAFQFVRIARHAQQGYVLEWRSATNKLYALQRGGIAGNFEDVYTGIAATPPSNVFWDSAAPAGGATFYRLRLDNGHALPMSRIFKDPLGGVSVQWLSASNQTYTVQRATNLSSGFLTLQSNLLANPPTNSFRDAGATGNGSYFYRVGAQ